MTTTTSATDQIGRDVVVGDWIAYGVGRGCVTTGLVLGFKESLGDIWDGAARKWVTGIVVKIQVKSPHNARPSLIEAERRQFLRIEPREEGAEFGDRDCA